HQVIRSGDPKLTEATHGHLAADYLRTEVNRPKLEGMPVPEVPRRRTASADVTPVLPTGPKSRRGRSCAGETRATPTPSACRGDRIRTCDPLVPNQVLYQAEPLPEADTPLSREALRNGFDPTGSTFREV